MSVSYDENSLNTKGIVGAVESSGYGAKPKDDRRNTKAEKTQVSTAQAEYKGMKQRLWLSVTFTLPLSAKYPPPCLFTQVGLQALATEPDLHLSAYPAPHLYCSVNLSMMNR